MLFLSLCRVDYVYATQQSSLSTAAALSGSNKRSSYNSWCGMLSHVLTIPPLSFRIERVIIMNGRFFSDRTLNPKLPPPLLLQTFFPVDKGMKRFLVYVSGQLFSFLYFRRFLPLQSISCDVKMCSFSYFFCYFDYFGSLDRQRLNPPLMGWDGRVHATPFSHHQTSPRVIDTILFTIYLQKDLSQVLFLIE